MFDMINCWKLNSSSPTFAVGDMKSSLSRGETQPLLQLPDVVESCIECSQNLSLASSGTILGAKKFLCVEDKVVHDTIVKTRDSFMYVNMCVGDATDAAFYLKRKAY